MQSPAWIIARKRDGKSLSREDIRDFIRGITTGDVADYQASAFCMATFFRGMTPAETIALTEAMLESGERYDLSSISGPKVDKHSTGGVGDKVSLILAPLAAACGVKVPMMSGRGLGHSGGTLDKLESIRGFDVKLSRERFEKVLEEVGCAMIGQSDSIAPADKKLYALRDVTGTVECIPLIVASILSKKLAEGSEGLVLDVKTGSGAFMKTPARARQLATALTRVANRMGLRCRALLTDMSQPLGYAVGNALEVRESIEVLRDGKNGDPRSSDLRELTLRLCAEMIVLGGLAKNPAAGRRIAEQRLDDGSALRKFEELVVAQGGSSDQALDPSKLPLAPIQVEWKARKRGYITRMNTETIGRILVDLGGGRKKTSDPVDPAVGLVFHRKLGDIVKPNEPIATVYASTKIELTEMETRFQDAIEIKKGRKPVPKLVFGRI